MILRGFAYIAIFLVSIILQSTFFHYFEVLGAKPDLLLVAVILLSVLRGKHFGAAIGFAYGLMEDIFVGRYIGLQALSKMVTGYLFGHLERQIFQDNFVVPLVVTFVATIFHHFFVFFVLLISGSRIMTSSSFLVLTLATALYNVFIAAVVYGRFYRSTTSGLLKKLGMGREI